MPGRQLPFDVSGVRHFPDRRAFRSQEAGSFFVATLAGVKVSARQVESILRRRVQAPLGGQRR